MARMNWKTKKFILVQCVGKSTIRTTKNVETDHYNTESIHAGIEN